MGLTSDESEQNNKSLWIEVICHELVFCTSTGHRKLAKMEAKKLLTSLTDLGALLVTLE